jgi:tetratricopeptide (TPR) repeat protein
MEIRLGNPPIRENLGSIGIRDLYGLLALQLLSPKEVDRLAASTKVINTDRHPRLEYEAPRAFFDGTSSNLLRALDEKGKPLWVSPLLLSQYAALRGPGVAAFEGILEHQEKESSHNEEFVIGVLEAFREKAPGDARPLRELAVRYLKRGDYGSAEARVKELIGVDHENMDYLELLADIRGGEARRQISALNVPDLPALREVLLDLIRVSPQKGKWFLRLARLEEERGEWWRAIGTYESAAAHLRRESPGSDLLWEIGESVRRCHRRAEEARAVRFPESADP